MSFIQELKRRNVFRVGLAYVLIAWVLLQAADFGFDLVDAPNWLIQSLFVVAVIGFPAALVLGFWLFAEWPEPRVLIGAVLIIAAAAYTLHRERIRGQRTKVVTDT